MSIYFVFYCFHSVFLSIYSKLFLTLWLEIVHIDSWIGGGRWGIKPQFLIPTPEITIATPKLLILISESPKRSWEFRHEIKNSIPELRIQTRIKIMNPLQYHFLSKSFKRYKECPCRPCGPPDKISGSIVTEERTAIPPVFMFLPHLLYNYSTRQFNKYYTKLHWQFLF